MNLEQLRDAVRVRLGVPADDNFYPDEVLDSLVNEALLAIDSENEWPWKQIATTFSTTSGDGSYAPPAGWEQTKKLWITNDDTMALVSLDDALFYTGTGRPYLYAIQADEILLRPIPDGVYTINHLYYAVETELVDNTDEPTTLPSQFHTAIVQYATYLAHERAGREDRAQGALRVYNQTLQRMLAYKLRTTRVPPIRVRPGRDY